MTWVTVKSRGTEDCTQAMECCNLAEIRISSEVENQQQFLIWAQEGKYLSVSNEHCLFLRKCAINLHLMALFRA